MALPPVRVEHNLKLIGHNSLGAGPNAGEGLAMKVTPDGRWLFYVAHENPPMAMSILDVTDPTKPELVYQSEVPHNDVRGNSLAIRGDTLLLASQCKNFGQQPAGFTVFDLSDPIQPREVAFFDTSGPHSQGVHYVSLIDGRYAHITTGAADFEPNHPKDHQFYMIVDLEDRSKPKEVGRWWLPGQRKGDPEGPLKRHEARYDFGYRPHNILCFPERPDRAYVGYIDGGIVILDISDKSNPRLVSRVDYHPPFPGFTHTVLPLFDRGLLVVADEATGDEGADWPKLVWMVDVREETNPIIISTLPFPERLRRICTGRRADRRAQHPRERPRARQRDPQEHRGGGLVQRRPARLRHPQPVPPGGDRRLPAGDPGRPARLPHQRLLHGLARLHLRRRPRARRHLRAGVHRRRAAGLTRYPHPSPHHSYHGAP